LSAGKWVISMPLTLLENSVLECTALDCRVQIDKLVGVSRHCHQPLSLAVGSLSTVFSTPDEFSCLRT
jgi:hypothetical protein